MKIMKSVSLVLAAMTVFVFAACDINPENSSGGSTAEHTARAAVAPSASDEPVASGKLFDKPTTIKMITSSHPTYPYDANWFIWSAITEATNVTLEVSAYTSEEYEDKINLIMASGELPDFIYLPISTSNKYALDGPFVNVTENLSKVPNFKKWYDSSEDSKKILKTYTSADGNVYIFPLVGTEVTMNKMGWLARKDVLDKNKLAVPTTYDELYIVLKELKKIYPDSYPLSFRDFFNDTGRGFELYATQWATSTNAYYDYDKSEWRYGPIEDNFRELLKYFRKLYAEGLIPPDILTMVSKGWTDLMSSSRSFFTTDFAIRIDYFNNPMRKENPDANLDLIAPPKGSVANGIPLFAKTSYAGGGDCVCSGKNIDNTLKFIDWMYSDEGCELLVWGREGKTYNVVDGKRQFITDENKTGKEKMYGLLTFGVNLRGDPDAVTMQYSKQTLDALYKTDDYMAKEYNPKLWIDFTKAEKDIKLSVEESIKSYMQEHVANFITGELSLDTQWDAYVAGIRQLGVDQYLGIFKTAYDRVK